MRSASVVSGANPPTKILLQSAQVSRTFVRYLRACQEWVAVPGSEGCVEALRRVAVFLRGPASARVVFRRPRPNSCLLRISLETAACCQTPQKRVAAIGRVEAPRRERWHADRLRIAAHAAAISTSVNTIVVLAGRSRTFCQPLAYTLVQDPASSRPRG